MIARKILLLIYLFLIFLFGILLVPFKLVWGAQKEIDSIVFAPIWSTIYRGKVVNGYSLFYELYTGRLALTLVVLSLIFIALFKFFTPKEEV